MMPFLIRLFPLQDIAPPLLLSIIQYLTRGDFTEFRRSDDCVISCDTLIWAYGSEALMQTRERTHLTRDSSLLRGPTKGPADLSGGFNYSHLVPPLICILSVPFFTVFLPYFLVLNGDIRAGDGFPISFSKPNEASRFILQSAERGLTFCHSWLSAASVILIAAMSDERLRNRSKAWLNHKQTAPRTQMFKDGRLHCPSSGPWTKCDQPHFPVTVMFSSSHSVGAIPWFRGLLKELLKGPKFPLWWHL